MQAAQTSKCACINFHSPPELVAFLPALVQHMEEELLLHLEQPALQLGFDLIQTGCASLVT